MGRRLRASDQLWVDGYVRVSKVGLRRGERFISPAAQREAIDHWAAWRGARLLEVFEELDAPGGRFDRPQLQRAIERIEAGISQGIVVDKVDRFGRSLVHGLLTVQRIQAAGGAVFAVHDGLDSTTDAGRFVLRNMLSTAEWEVERRRAAWEVARRYAISRGVHCGSRSPIGYRKTRSGRLRPDPQKARWITELFARRAAGESLTQLARWLEANHVRTSMGNPGWSPMTVKPVLRNRVYLGEVHSRPYVRAGAHPPLTEPTTWELAQGPRQPCAPVQRRPTLLAGIVRCAGCGHPLMAANNRPLREPPNLVYSCVGRHATGPCPAPAAIGGRLLEPLVEASALRVLASRRSRPDAELRAARDAAASAERALTAYRDSPRVLSILGSDAFAAGLQARAHQLRRARLHQATVEARSNVHELPSVHEVRAQWDSMALEDRRAVIQATIDCVFVTRGKAPPEERVTIFPVGTGPTKLPSRRDRRRASTMFLPSTSTGLPRRELDPAVLHERLRRFTRGQTTWPTPDVFRRHGRAALYAQAVWQGGERYWAARLGLAFPYKIQQSGPWTEDRIRASLRVFLAERDNWPAVDEFAAAGLLPLHRVLSRNGGSARWAREFSVPVRRYPRGHWTPDAIRTTLTEFCEGRTRFPTEDEFVAARLGGLHSAMAAEHSVQRWADELGLPRATGGRRRKRDALLPMTIWDLVAVARCSRLAGVDTTQATTNE